MSENEASSSLGRVLGCLSILIIMFLIVGATALGIGFFWRTLRWAAGF